MSERNRFVPFPELTGQTSELETLIIDSVTGEFIPYKKLPDQISAGRIETYANWLSELTQSDPQRLERDGFLHVRTTNNQIIYPSNPNVGTKDGVRNTVTEVFSQNLNKFRPIFDVHSHPRDTCHSSEPGDLGSLLYRHHKGIDISKMQYGTLVATPGYNYMMLKSSDTMRDINVLSFWFMLENNFDINGSKEFCDIGKKYSTTMDPISHRNTRRACERDSKYSLEQIFTGFTEAIYLSEEFKLGFYRSNKDGNYVRFTRPMVMEHLAYVKTQAEEAFSKAIFRPSSRTSYFQRR